ncbi:MAG: VWA domain-containing protein [Pyrinomonadaceae bacterium]|nr:VWA domain-containing protein [Pyrinomonadaceae bacterium]
MRSYKLSAIYSFLFLAVFAVGLSAQTPTPTPIEEEEGVVKVESRLIVVPVAITNSAGEPVQGLTQRDFRIAEEGRNQVIETVANADAVPLEIVLLFDVSASTDAMFKFQQETAAKFLQEVMRTEDRATIFTIGENPQLIQARETAERSMVAVRSIVPAKKYTAFYDSIGEAGNYLQRNAPSGTRRVIVVISDGEDTNSTRVAKAIQDGYVKAGRSVNTLDQKALYQLTVKNRDTAAMQERVRIVKSLQDADTVFYSINPAGSSYQLNKMSQFGQENMQKFADETGGTAFLPKFLPVDTKDALANTVNMKRNAEMLEKIFKQLAAELRAQYLVQYYSDGDYSNGKFVKLNVSLNGRSDLKVRARQGYYVKN